MIPSRSQWRQWSLPSRLTAVGTFLGLISVLLAVTSLRETSEHPRQEMLRLDLVRPGATLDLVKQTLGAPFSHQVEGLHGSWAWDLGEIWVVVWSKDFESADAVQLQLNSPTGGLVPVGASRFLLGETTFGELDPLRGVPGIEGWGGEPACDAPKLESFSRGVWLSIGNCTYAPANVPLVYTFGMFAGQRVANLDDFPEVEYRNGNEINWQEMRELRPNYASIAKHDFGESLDFPIIFDDWF